MWVETLTDCVKADFWVSTLIIIQGMEQYL